MKLSLSASSVSLLLLFALSPQPAATQTLPVTRLSGSQTSIVTRTSTAATDTIAQSDCGKLISYSNPNGIAVTLPAASSLLSGCWMDVQNTGAGTVTITSSASTIDGVPYIALSANQGLRIVDAATQYLTQRGQGSGSGSGGGGTTYSADGTSLNLIGTTFSANTAVLASRVTGAQGLDTACVTPTGGSSTAYAGAMLGNAYSSAYAEGMRVLVEINTTTIGGAITLDCGSGPKAVYQNDGASYPTTAQWAAGQQVLVTYSGALNSSAGGWRMLSGSGSSSGVTAPAVSNLLQGNGSGGISDSTIAPANVPLLNGTNVFTGSVTANSGGFNTAGQINFGNGSGATYVGGNSTTGRAYISGYYGADVQAATTSFIRFMNGGQVFMTPAAVSSLACGPGALADGSTSLGMHREASDATVATPGSIAVGGGPYTVGIECIYNSNTATYSWIID